MPWEQRGNGSYYYRKRREGGRVISEYLGAGHAAALAAQLEDAEREERAAARDAELQARAATEASDPLLAELETLLQTLTRAVLLSNGYHQHKGQWRRKRG